MNRSGCYYNVQGSEGSSPRILAQQLSVGGVRLTLELSALQSLAVAATDLNVISSRDFQTSDSCHYLSSL